MRDFIVFREKLGKAAADVITGLGYAAVFVLLYNLLDWGLRV